MLDFLIPILAKLWDAFKLKDPRLAAIVALALGTVIYFATQSTLLGVITVSPTVAGIIQTVATIWLAINGSRTTSYLKGK